MLPTPEVSLGIIFSTSSYTKQNFPNLPPLHGLYIYAETVIEETWARTEESVLPCSVRDGVRLVRAPEFRHSKSDRGFSSNPKQAILT